MPVIEMKYLLLLTSTIVNASPVENDLENYLQKNECTYDEGTWSKCQDGSQVREDLLHLSKISNLNCAVTKTVRRSCGIKGKCVFEKSRRVPWTGCLDVGLTQKVLHLISDGGNPACPRQKLVSRKCRKNANRNSRSKRRNQLLARQYN